jgi:hypothetical protein
MLGGLNVRKLMCTFVVSVLVAVAGIFNVSAADSPPPGGTASPDDLFVEVARRVPGFGGAFVDESANQLKIWLSQPTAEGAVSATNALEDVFADPQFVGYIPVPLKARYDFPTLKAWHDDLSLGIGGMAGVTSNDIDERINRLRVGIENIEAKPEIEGAITALNVPLAAVSIVEEEPVHFQTLQEFHRPVLGGLQIVRDAGDVWYICTAGFVATSGLVTGIVTNAHCSKFQGEPWDGTTYYQPDPVVDALGAATEVSDPAFFTGGVCPAGKRCRYSDASWNQWICTPPPLQGCTPMEKGSIANAAAGSPAWDHVTTIPVKSKGNPVVGNRVIQGGPDYGPDLRQRPASVCRLQRR